LNLKLLQSVSFLGLSLSPHERNDIKMKKRLSAIFAIIGLVVAAYSLWFYSSSADVNRNTYVESHSPVIGNTSAPVTIVEFFDPACEACAAISPFVKSILAENPQDVRLVLRYALFMVLLQKRPSGFWRQHANSACLTAY
jgi:protein-disulfide isomerase